MTPLEEQFAALRERYSEASLTQHPDGSATVVIPNVSLPEGWEPRQTTVRFIVPVGYPQSRPDCFWTDAPLRLSGGRVPQNTGANPLPHGPPGPLWFSWHVQSWSPNFDTLLTYLNVISKRFQEQR